MTPLSKHGLAAHQHALDPGFVNGQALPSWLRGCRDHLSTHDQTRRWQRIIDMLLAAGYRRVADLAD
ncbi:hypothetical protein [Nocardia nepalensis]|uniref:hypothetical protein n=1 Tax=Nocardia nepalensis TaxID=3375448 RepID=UPI003B67D562